MFNFKNKSVLITGGSRGIGAATVQLFSDLGANVAFNYLHNEAAAMACKEKTDHNPGETIVYRCDISIHDQVQKFVQFVIEQFGRIDILVNNAGIWKYGAIDIMTEDDWQETLKINLNSVFYFTQSVVVDMKAKNIRGKIINIASTAGQRGEAFHSHYAASKGAIISLTKSLAAELGPSGILVNCVAPGWVHTDMSEEAIKLEGDKIRDQIPLQRIPTADEIAGPIVFLASDWASAITGEILNVNSGSVLCG